MKLHPHTTSPSLKMLVKLIHGQNVTVQWVYLNGEDKVAVANVVTWAGESPLCPIGDDGVADEVVAGTASDDRKWVEFVHANRIRRLLQTNLFKSVLPHPVFRYPTLML